MKLLIVASNKGGDFSPFVAEQKDALIRAGIQVASYPHSAHGIMNYIREIKYLRCAIKREKPNVVHAHFGLTGLMATLAAIGMRVPVVVTYHGCDINDIKNRPFSQLAMRLATWNIFVGNRQMLNAYCTENNARKYNNWSIIPCGVNINDFDKSKIDIDWFNSRYPIQNKVLFAGSFESIVKNASLAKQAVEIYNAMHPNAMVDLIELRGYTREEVVTLMHMCKSLLLTSIREGSPQVIKEAMACGCPIVSVDVGDVAERLDHMEGGYVISSRKPQDIANALEHAIHFGRTKGREKLLEDGMDNVQVAAKLIEIYKKVILK